MADNFPEDDQDAFDGDAEEESLEEQTSEQDEFPAEFEEEPVEDEPFDEAQAAPMDAEEDLHEDEVEAQAEAPDEKAESFEEAAPGEESEPVDFEQEQPVANQPSPDDNHEESFDQTNDRPDRAPEAFDVAQEPEPAAEPQDDFDEPIESTTEGLGTEDTELGTELDSVLNPPAPEPVDAEPLPDVGPATEPAYVELWHGGEKQDTLTLAFDRLLFGLAEEDGESQIDGVEPTEAPAGPPEAPPASEPEQAVEEESGEVHDDVDEPDEDEEVTEQEVSSEADEFETVDVRRQPDVDFGEYGIDEGVWHNHLAIHRRNRHHYVYALADATLQVNNEPLELGDARELADGDIIVAGEQTALVFRT